MTEPIELFRVQRINGVPMPLGTMSYAELVGVYTEVKRREHVAHEEGALVMHYLQVGEATRFPEAAEFVAAQQPDSAPDSPSTQTYPPLS